jgi:hypothetical protein
VSYDAPFINSVETTVESKLSEWVSPEDFGAVGDGVADDTAAIQNALDTSKTVIFPSNSYRITASLEIGGQNIIGLGSVNNSGFYGMTKLFADGNFPAIVNKTSGNVTFEIENFFIYYSDTTPTGSTGNDQKIGLYFNDPGFPGTPGPIPQFCKISNVLIKGAWYGYYQYGGMYLSILERVWTWSCKFGFNHYGGTTIEFNNCYSLFGSQAFNVQGVVNVTVLNSGQDRIVVAADTPQLACSVFADIPGLFIGTFGGELCEATRNESSLMYFINTTGTFNGLFHTQQTLSCAAGQEVYGVRLFNSRMQFTGCPGAVNVNDLAFTGTGGNCFALAASDGSRVEIKASNFVAPTGGTPTIRYSLGQFSGAEVFYSTTVVNNVFNARQLDAAVAINVVAVLNSFTVTGTPVVTAKTWQNGNQVNVNISIDPNGGTVASAAGVSNITGLSLTPAYRSTCQVVTSAFASGVGLVTTLGEIYTPSISPTGSVITITSTYFVG